MLVKKGKGLVRGERWCCHLLSCDGIEERLHAAIRAPAGTVGVSSRFCVCPSLSDGGQGPGTRSPLLSVLRWGKGSQEGRRRGGAPHPAPSSVWRAVWKRQRRQPGVVEGLVPAPSLLPPGPLRQMFCSDSRAREVPWEDSPVWQVPCLHLKLRLG